MRITSNIDHIIFIQIIFATSNISLNKNIKYYVRSDCMCSTNVVFNMKTVENVLIFCLEYFRLKNFWSLFSQFSSLNFFYVA